MQDFREFATRLQNLADTVTDPEVRGPLLSSAEHYRAAQANQAWLENSHLVAQANQAWLENSHLVAQGLSINSAAETYDEMNENTVLMDSLRLLDLA
jgi:hypothetical protein